MYLNGLLGGMVIGLAAVLLMYLLGRTLGVSGILSGILKQPDNDFFWRLFFLVGLICGGLITRTIFSVNITLSSSTLELIMAGLCVGFGTVLGGGCTSGHGICGISRFSKRSFVATLVFMIAGILTVFVRSHLGG